MDYVAYLKHLALDFELGCGFLLFGSFKQVYTFLCLFLLFAFGFKFLFSDKFSRSLIRFLCDLRGELKTVFCSTNVIDGKFWLLKLLKENSCVPLIVDKMEVEKNVKLKSYTYSNEECGVENNEDDESDVSILRKLIKIERHRANVACAELAKERAASATAAEEAMAMILRLQNEKSLIEMELNQYRRLAEEKQIHDQEVIRSLQWLVWQHESERSLLEDELKLCRQEMKKIENEECEKTRSFFDGNILDALENVLYSSRDDNSSSSPW